jgi:Domain of unknown function (DUF1905)
MKPLKVTSTIEHKHAGLPRFVCVPMSKVDPWKLEGTITVEVTINGVDVGRRSLKRWDDRVCWWMDLADAVCRKANVETGDRVQLSLRIASEELLGRTRHFDQDPSAGASQLGTAHTGSATHAARRNPHC